MQTEIRFTGSPLFKSLTDTPTTHLLCSRKCAKGIRVLFNFETTFYIVNMINISKASSVRKLKPSKPFLAM